MQKLRGWIKRLGSLFSKQSKDRDLEAEIESHLQMHIDDNLKSGMSSEEARRQAMIKMGGLESAKELYREQRGVRWLENLIQDVRFGFRMLKNSPGFTFIIALILALGIGANVAVFSIVNTILLRPLPFPDAQQLVRIVEKNSGSGESSRTYTADATQDFQQQNQSFQSVSGYFAFSSPNNFKLVGKDQPVPVTGLFVAEGFFQTLGVQPSLGRMFRSEEFAQHAPPAVVLSNPFWRRQFGGDAAIVGQTIHLNNALVTVIGVLPAAFDFGAVFSPGAKIDLFAPYIMDDYRDDGNDLALVGRLKPGKTLAQAQSEADQLFPQLYFEHKHPEYGKGYTGQLTGLKDYISGKLRRSLIVLWCAVGLILLIVCLNLSNLLMARAAARRREFAVRLALGASRGRLVCQLIIESLIPAGFGAALGLGLATAVITSLAHQGSIALPLLSSVRIDGTVLCWTILITIAATVLIGVAPALGMSVRNLQERLKDGGRGASEGRKHERIRSSLVIMEIGMACVLLVCAGLLLRSFLRILDVDLGFEPSRAAAISVDFEDNGNSAKRSAAWEEVVGRSSAIPGVEAAGITDNLPMSRNRSWGIGIKGEPKSNIGVFVYIISPGYLKAMGMRLLEGRDLSWTDLLENRNVVIINQTVARKLWPTQDPIGRFAVAGGADAEVIGVIADVRESSAEDNAGAQMYLPATKQFGPEGSFLVVRSKLPSSALATTVMQRLRETNPGQSATEFKPIQRLVDRATSPRRFFVLLVSAFACFGLVLASLGIYGIISYSVTRQTQEIGIRMALGATRSRIQQDVVWKTLRLAVSGLFIGVIASLAVVRLIESLLFQTTPNDPLTFAAMAFILCGVACLAGYFPARRAAKVDPMTALRQE
ncbi:MAG TPA: ABC transporter permease [Verrucomicrobiae bacterium]|jgi:predicted permease